MDWFDKIEAEGSGDRWSVRARIAYNFAAQNRGMRSGDWATGKGQTFEGAVADAAGRARGLIR